MGSYLSEPVTEKESTDQLNDNLNCGASSMQGWRVSQEDAHNCILDYDTDTSFFAVYDGHGGQEVALYCADKLPQFIKDTEAYKSGDVEKALIDGFLGFDAAIATREVVAVLKELAGEKEAEESEDDEENVTNLYEEATMPIEQVIEKYTSNLVNPAIRNLKKDVDKFPKSPYLKAKKENDDNVVGTSTAGCSSEASGSCSNENNAICNDGVSSSSNEVNNEVEVKDVKVESNGSANGDQSKASLPDSSDTKEALSTTSDQTVPVETINTNTTLPTENGVESAPNSEASAKPDDISSSVNNVENGEICVSDSKIKGKGKAKIEKKQKPINTRPKRNAQQLYKQWLDFGDDSDDTDEEDQTFQGSNEDSSDDDETNDTSNVGGESGEEESSEIADDEEEEGEEEDTDDDDDDDDEMENDEDEEGLAFAREMKEEPGSDSGCTAVVALLKGNQLFVANAGDSRCIVCRNGKAVEMSFDHKPEDEPERERVIKAGGRVTSDGRVNGGLNLSRAIGDHAYKQNKILSDREQMITALPDVKTLTIQPQENENDEFMVLACDGIWNFMSSQEVVDFIRPRIQEDNLKLSQICEEMFDHCLAPNTLGDGTGCDNMTAIIVKFKPNNSLKRAASASSEESGSKRAKTEENEPQIDTTV